MSMLPVAYARQSHCLSSDTLESSKLHATTCGKYGKRITIDSHKLDLKQRTIYVQLKKSVTRISYNHHVPKAVATPDVSVMKTSEIVATYRFMMEIDGQLKVLVTNQNSNKYELYVEVESLLLSEGEGDLVMIWGLFRSDSKSFMPLDSHRLSAASNSSTIETPFLKDSSGRLAVELDLNETSAPFYVSILLKSKIGSDSKFSTIKSHRKTNFIVPVGFGSGRPSPLGISLPTDGFVNFSFFSQNVENVVLCLFADNKAEKPALEIDLDPYVNRTGDIWHALVDCSSVPFVSYGYRCRSGSDNKEHRVLLDPYATVIDHFGPKKMLGSLSREPAFDWSGEFSPSTPMEKLIIYRLNVTRFTKDKSSKLSGDIAGSFSGISEKLHHFKSLGVNAILLEPLLPFDEKNGPYFPSHFFSPGSSFGPSADPETAAKSMKEMVKKLHAAGIEVLLEVVFTHTGESAALKEIDNSSYYHVKGGENLTSTNSLNCNYPIAQELILQSLRYWVTEFHIDGFSFINASSLTIGFHGETLSRPPLVEAIAFDPLLSRVKIIADSWDPHDSTTKEIIFPHWKRWAEMNTKFCIDVRKFLQGQGLISDLATRLCGSGDLFLAGRGPAFSFNFITRNSGLTLVDLVSFSSSENLESQLSWNCGEEGATNKVVVLERRLKQIRNFLFILFISLGVPVLNMGDECGQSCGGSTGLADRGPLDWNAMRAGFGTQVMQFISFLSLLKVRRSDLLQRRTYLEVDSIEWQGTEWAPPNWDDPLCKFVAVTLKADEESTHGDLFIAFNGGDQSERVDLPSPAVDATWVCLVDTALPFPGFFSVDDVPLEAGVETYEVKSNSCILFEARSL